MDVFLSSAESSRGLKSRLKILETAEQLYALRGIDAVSIREINKAAGQRNGSAVQYHFRNRDGLLDAIFALRTRARNNQRFVMLDKLKEQQDARRITTRALAEVIVKPMFMGLGQGPTTYHRRFIKQIHQNHRLMNQLLSQGHDTGLRECFRMIKAQQPDTPLSILTQRYVHSNAIAIDAAANVEDLLEQADPALSEADIALHESCCIASITAIFEAAVTDDMRQLASETSAHAH